MKKPSKALAILRQETGQAITEYAIVFSLAVAPLFFIKGLQIAIQNYLRGIYYFLGLSIF